MIKEGISKSDTEQDKQSALFTSGFFAPSF